MYIFSKSLGRCVKNARIEQHLTQAKVADKIDVDSRTILNIENECANPKMEVLYPLIRALQIDPHDIFYPELSQNTSALHRLQILLMECSEEEIELLLPICREAIKLIKSPSDMTVK